MSTISMNAPFIMQNMLRSFLFGLCLCCLTAPLFSIPPIIHDLRTGYLTKQGPAFLIICLEDRDGDAMQINLAEVSYQYGRDKGNFVSFLSNDLKTLRFTSGTDGFKVFNVLWQIPEEFLLLDKFDLHFRMQVTDGEKFSEIFNYTEFGVDIKAERERSWQTLVSGVREKTVATFHPGNYIIINSTAAGFSAHFGEATNMGMVDIYENDKLVTGSPFDLYPAGAPAPTNATVFTNYIRKRVIDLESANRPMKIKIELKKEKNASSLSTGMTFGGFMFDFYGINPRIPMERDVPVDANEVILFSVPPSWDAALFMPYFELGFGMTRVTAKASGRKKIELPENIIGYRMESGAIGEALTIKQYTNDKAFDISDWPKDKPMRLKLSWLGKLGIPSQAAVDGLFVNLENPNETNLSGLNEQFKIENKSIEAKAVNVEKDSRVQWKVFENQTAIKEHSKEAKVFVVQDPSQLEGHTLEFTTQKSDGLAVYSYDTRGESFVLLSSDDQETYRGKSNVFVVDYADLAKEGDAANETAATAGGGGGGCLLKRR